ncbi:MAG: hypothetical protein KAX42_02985, partial [Sphaerotilus sp.]|nr:hypothetical protein [Sphaerotilus sp.]
MDTAPLLKARLDAVCRDTLGLVPRPSQWLAAEALVAGRLAELATGEGKTLALALAAALLALRGRTVHLLTANDYLAARDAQQLAGWYARLGLRASHVSAEQPAAHAPPPTGPTWCTSAPASWSSPACATRWRAARSGRPRP